MEKINSVLIFMSFLISISNSIKCYSCNSEYDANCSDPFIPSDHTNLVLDCEQEVYRMGGKVAEICEKTTEWVDNVFVTTRGCYDSTKEDVVELQHSNGDNKDNKPCSWKEGKQTIGIDL